MESGNAQEIVQRKNSVEIKQSDGTTKQQVLISDQNFRKIVNRASRHLDQIADIVQSEKVNKTSDKFYLYDNHKNSQLNFGFHENGSEDGPNTSFASNGNFNCLKDDQNGSSCKKLFRKLSTIEEHA